MMGKNLKLEEVVSIERVGKHHTYDFNMPTGCFIANNFLVHNSDTCLILVWDWEKGRYKVCIEKQRHGEVKDIFVNFLPEYSAFEDIDYEKEPFKA